MLFIEDKWVCGECKPTFVQMVREGVSMADITVARRNKILIMGKQASLPNRCVKCNVPTSGHRLTKKLYWHNPLIYLFFLINLLVYALAAIITRKRAIIEISLCEQHASQRKTNILVSWILVVASIALIVMGFANNLISVGLAGIALLLGALVYAALKTPVVTARKIDKEYVWLTGAGKEFLNSLPEF